MKALVSIITVNYNGLRDTCEMIDSFRNHETYPHYEIIVVDNGSRLPEAEEIQERYRGNLVPDYNPQIEMFARFKTKSSFHKTKRII